MQINRLPAVLLSILLLLLMGTLAACGGGGGNPGDAPGNLTVTVSGLPAGASAPVTVTGPGGFSQAVPQTVTLLNLVAGAYTVSAGNIINGATTFAPSPASQAVTVSPDATANASVRYAAQGALALGLEVVAAGLSTPVFLTAPPGDNRQFIVERPGRIRILENGVLLPQPFLDITARTTVDGERGLLSMAFHPQYARNGFFFIYYTDVGGNIVIERRTVAPANPNLADALSDVRILTLAHSAFSNHNGGLLAFGPDGFLYIGAGDGGGAGDPLGNGQNFNSLLGKLLRIDVANSSAAQPYAIPPNNPFLGQAGRRGEIWAAGLRNPWRFAFDALTGSTYIADVGQDLREEVNVASTSLGGNNYGWNRMEGSQCFNTTSCDRQGLTLPVFEYDHASTGGCSITGGFVYRGAALPELAGRYFYSDFCGGWLKSFVFLNGAATEQVDWGVSGIGSVVSFGQDAKNELYLLSANGSVYRMVRK
jgi:glucose/arabinose dehydrogenase